MLAVHWDKATDAVGFEVCSFSWPQHPLAKIALPIVHLTQRKVAPSKQFSTSRLHFWS
jgi:uncharacterized protein (UPF0548 family)